ncbi:MAG: tetratricopeptide repeat protein, partial [Opitutaceae bacterium]
MKGLRNEGRARGKDRGRRAALGLLAVAVLGGAGCTRRMRERRHLSRADHYYAAADYAEAETEYRAALHLNPRDPAPLRQLGLVYFGEGRFMAAYRYLSTAAKADPKNPEIRLKLGMAALGLDAPQKAWDDADAVLAEEPANGRALLLLADASRTPEDREALRKTVERLQHGGHDSAACHLVLARFLAAARNPAGAEAEIRKALALDPKSSAAYGELATLDLLRRDTKDAGEAYR